jgi:hypothetical protein
MPCASARTERAVNLSHDNTISPTLGKDGSFTTHREISVWNSLLRKEKLHTKWAELGQLLIKGADAL